jgi:hypothetical protein
MHPVTISSGIRLEHILTKDLFTGQLHTSATVDQSNDQANLIIH